MRPPTVRRRLPAIAVLAAVLMGAPATAAPAPLTIVPSPNEGAGPNELWGVDTESSQRAVAVGARQDPGSGEWRTLVQQWDGTTWQTNPSPNASGFANILYAVAFSKAPGEVWAVGSAATEAGHPDAPTRTLILRYARGDWTIVPSPSPSGARGRNEFHAVRAFSPTSVWAVGQHQVSPGAPGQTLVARWDGTQWTRLASPNPRPSNRLLALGGTADNDVWAVGAGGPVGAERPLVLHWNGFQWREFAPPESNDGGILNAVTALASNDVWAVGSGLGTPMRPAAMHFDGFAWSDVPVPTGGVDLTGVTTSTRGTDVWVSGYAWRPPGTRRTRMFVARWTGGDWELCGMPREVVSAMRTIAPAADGAVWAVGHHEVIERPGIPSTLILRADLSQPGRC